MYTKYIKKFLDFFFSIFGFVILAIPMAIIALLIRLEDGGPALFTQKRVGKDKTYFNMYKFRTMKVDAPHDVATHLLENPEQYLSKIGKFLRVTSLDELPQIFNIIKGDMSFIGPRPALWNQYDLIEERDKYNANSVRPGLTGWAQVNGRDEIDIYTKSKLDGEYVSNISLAFDFKVFIITIGAVIKQSGIVEGNTGKVVNIKTYIKEKIIKK